jgi:hypothetical protein
MPNGFQALFLFLSVSRVTLGVDPECLERTPLSLEVADRFFAAAEVALHRPPGQEIRVELRAWSPGRASRTEC